MITYDPFWNYIAERHITQYALLNQYGFNTNLIHRLKHNKPVSTTTLDTICSALDCNVCDILEYRKDNPL